jgi:hypothetical protein
MKSKHHNQPNQRPNPSSGIGNEEKVPTGLGPRGGIDIYEQAARKAAQGGGPNPFGDE